MKRLIIICNCMIIPLTLISQKWVPELTEQWEPVPEVITPGTGTAPPSDAIILFDGTGLDQWVSYKDGSAAQWDINEEILTVSPGKGSIMTKQAFGDIQLHLEWRSPEEITGDSQKRGNSGVYLQKRYEVQILDSYNNITYPNGQAGSVYKQHIPLVNACLPPGQWQTYDIIFTAPRFKADGSLFSPARITLLHNGILVLNNIEIKGNTEFIGLPEYSVHDLRQPFYLQDHSNRVSFRNIWVREL